jgi:hypothetical protein
MRLRHLALIGIGILFGSGASAAVAWVLWVWADQPFIAPHPFTNWRSPVPDICSDCQRPRGSARHAPHRWANLPLYREPVVAIHRAS